MIQYYIIYLNEKSLTFLIYNAILTLMVASQNKSSVDWENFHCSNNVVYVYQISENDLQNRVSFYNGSLHMMTNFCQVFFCRELDLPVVLKDLPLGYLMVLPTLCIITNTVLLVLYIYFRNEPSIKSTSISLSLLIFLACYFLSLFTITFVIHESQKLLSIDLCILLIPLSGYGLSLPLISAALLVKMLMVYRIFTQFRIIKRKIYTSIYAQLVYSIFIVSPTIIIILLWSFIDPIHNDIQYVEHSGFFSVAIDCSSDYLVFTVFTTMLLGYNFLLLLVVVIVAVKSRKIRMKQFKDTKKVNILIFLKVFIGISTVLYSEFFSNDKDVRTYILYSGHLSIAFLCQIFLFIPKVWPPVCDRLFSKKVHRDIGGFSSNIVVSKHL